MKQIVLPLLGTVIFILLVGLLAKNSGNLKGIAKMSPSPTTPPTKTIKVGNTSLKVEVADTKDERSLGLGNRGSFPSDRGMLFIFDTKPVIANFWMKDMGFAIDIIWIKDSKVYKVDSNVEPEPDVADTKLKIYSTDRPIDYVLEVNAGFAKKYNITTGTTVDLSKAL